MYTNELYNSVAWKLVLPGAVVYWSAKNAQSLNANIAIWIVNKKKAGATNASMFINAK